MNTRAKPSFLSLGKYKSIAFFISVFVILILGLLGLNLYISNQIQEKSKEITIAANQASLVQEMSKSVYIIISQYQKVLPYDNEAKKLLENLQLFDRRLAAFLGKTAQESSYVLPNKTLDPLAIEQLKPAYTIWLDYKESLLLLFDQQTANQAILLNALTHSERYSQELTERMNKLAAIIQENSENDANILRIIQIAGIVLAVLSFIWIIFYFIRFLRKGDYALEASQKETTGILQTVKEGLFLLDKELYIGNQYSNEMGSIFESEKIAGAEFAKLLERILPEEQITTVLEFVKLLFDPNVVEDLVVTLNPLTNTRVIITKPDGSRVEKYLDFSFNRVTSTYGIENILVSVRDLTDENRLRQELESSKEQSNRRMLLLDELLQADALTVDRFLISLKNSLSHINSVLKEKASNVNEFKQKLDEIFIEIHRIKGESTTIGFSDLSQKSHEFEDEVEQLKQLQSIRGLNFLPLTIKLNNLIKAAESIEHIATNISKRGLHKARTNSDIPPNTAKHEWSHLPELLDSLVKQYNKPTSLVMTGFSEIRLNPNDKSLINNISIQMIKNALIHGIEPLDERAKSQKDKQARIDLRLSKLSGDQMELVIRDDGRGFNVAAIKDKLLKRGDISESEAASWPMDKFVHKAFGSGFSTAQALDMNAGRGVGLPVIKDTVRKLGGRLSIKQASGQYCQFSITFPYRPLDHQS